MDKQERQDKQAIQDRQQNNWQLNRVDDIDWTHDGSGIYVYINWDKLTDSARLDIVRQADSEMLQSFIGKADNVRKAAMRWIWTEYPESSKFSFEHAAYIGAELERCDTERIDYVQQ